MQLLDTSGIAGTPSFARAQSISGDGRVILGANGGRRGLARVDGEMFDLYAVAQVNEAYTINHDGTKAVLPTRSGNVVMWGYRLGADGFTGFVPALYTTVTGWMSLTTFLEQQGTVEASNFNLFNPIVVSASGSEIFGTASNGYGFRIDLDQVYVCRAGESVLTGWLGGTALTIEDGAELGRCEFLP